jgi:hypothetical protein
MTETNISSDLALLKHMVITPMSTVAKAVETLTDDTSLTGKIAELHEGNVTLREQTEYIDDNTAKNIETFWSLGYA